MRMLFIICEASVDERVMAILDEASAPGYTRFTGASGNGAHGKRDGTPVWPGLNSIVMACVPDEMVPAVTAGIDRLREQRAGRLAVHVFSVPAEQVV
ncbi:MAG: hypothetical protein IT208_18675 [Chthonomonadales bacterium]|nr:hypothetical protein [Chthonomonadales bacterium]